MKSWTVSEAKARLSELLRLASDEGPQRIGTRTPYIVVPEALWLQHSIAREPLGQWLVHNLTPGEQLPLLDWQDPPRALPFEDELEE